MSSMNHINTRTVFVELFFCISFEAAYIFLSAINFVYIMYLPKFLIFGLSFMKPFVNTDYVQCVALSEGGCGVKVKDSCWTFGRLWPTWAY